MGTEVATTSRTELAQSSAYDPFAAAGNEMGGSSNLYAKFNGNSGEFTYGSQAEEIEKGERMAANIQGARHGWICWVESEVAEEIMLPVIEGPAPHEHTLKDHGPYKKYEDGTEDGWSKQFSIDFRLLGEAHDGAEITYKTTTKSAMRPLGDLLKQYGREYKMNPGKVPIVELDKGSYMPKEKKHGKKYFPIFKIVDWIDEEELLATYSSANKVEEGEENDNLIEAPKATKKAEAAPKATKKAEAAPAAATKKVEAAPAAETAAEKKARLLAELEAAEAEEANAAAADEEADSGDVASAEDATEVEQSEPAEKPRARRRSF